MAISNARKRANKKWDNENKEQIKYLRYRSYANTFIKKMAKNEDLKNIKILIESTEKRKEN